MGQQVDGTVVSAILIGFSVFLTWLVGQLGTKNRADRRRLRRLTKKDIAWAEWGHRVQVWAASKGYTDLPSQSRELLDDEEDDE